MNAATGFVLVLSIAMAAALLAPRVRIPYTVVLVLAGLGLGQLRAFAPFHLTRELLFTVFLPGLLFEASFHLDFAALRKRWATIAALAVPGVVATIAVTALIVTAAIRALGLDSAFGLASGVVFGGLIAATDPVAVTALFRSLRSPTELTTLLEGESLLNDGTSIVFLTLIVSAESRVAPSAWGIASEFFFVTGIGAAIGLVVGFAASEVIRRVNDPMIEITLTMIAAYGSFAVAEQIRASGVIATVAAGIVCGAYGRRVGMSAASREAATVFWEYAAFALNSVVFVMIGIEVAFSSVVRDWAAILAAYLAMVIARFIVVFGIGAIQLGPLVRLPKAWSTTLAWGGLRGALSMVLALSLPTDLPRRALLQTLTVGVVLLSLVVQGTTMSTLLRRSGLTTEARA